jgi:hypothetical protein
MNPPRSAFGTPPQGGAASGPAEPDPRRLLDRAGALQAAVALADAAGSVREAAAALRERFAGLRVVVVDAFDMRSETPAAIGQKRQLYLGASDGHCWSVTTDAGQAAGFFIAEKA